jgi:hypothetical protein
MVFQRQDPAVRFERHVDRSGEHHLWTGSTTDRGYAVFWDGYKPVRAHIWAYVQAHGPVPDGKEVTHSCGKRLCMRREHLVAKTHAENLADKIRHGTTGKKLDPGKVREIRALHEGGMTQVAIAERFGVRQTLISMVVRRQVWGHVK